MKRTALIALALAIFATCGCNKVVNLVLDNPTPDDLDVVVTQLDDHNMSKGDQSVGIVPKSGGKSNATLSLSKDGGYQVTATLPSSAQVFQETYSVGGQSSPISKTVSLSDQYSHVPDNGQELAGLFSSMGDNRGFTPRDLGNALKTIVGGILVYSPPEQGKTEPTVYYSLSPAQLGNTEMDLNAFPFVQTDQSADSDVERDTSTDLAGSVPIFGQLSANFSASTLYKVHAELKGFGAVQKPDAANWNIDDALAKLSDAQKKDLCVSLAKPNAQMLYANTVYSLQLASFDYQAAAKLATGVKADAGTVVTASAAYSFTDSQTKNFNVTSSALNFSGIVFTSDQVPCKSWSTPAPVAPQPPVQVGVTPQVQASTPPKSTHEALMIIQSQRMQIDQMTLQIQAKETANSAIMKASTHVASLPASILDQIGAHQ